MDHFNYVDGWLHAEEVPLARIAEAVGTPVYVYSAATLTRHFKLFQQALSLPDLLIGKPNVGQKRGTGRRRSLHGKGITLRDVP